MGGNGGSGRAGALSFELHTGALAANFADPAIQTAYPVCCLHGALWSGAAGSYRPPCEHRDPLFVFGPIGNWPTGGNTFGSFLFWGMFLVLGGLVQ